MKKIISVLFVCVLFFSLTGCGISSTKSIDRAQTMQTTSTLQSNTSKPKAEVTTVLTQAQAKDKTKDDLVELDELEKTLNSLDEVDEARLVIPNP